jgi:hypothetical protein
VRKPLALAAAAAAALLSPPGVASAAKQDVFRGKLEIRHSDDFARGRTHTSYRLVQGGRRIPLSIKRSPRIPSGTEVIVRGKRAGSRIRGTIRRRGIARAAAVTAPGPRDTAVILVNFATDTRTPWTREAVSARFFTDPDSVNAFYSEQSYDDVSLAGDVYGWYTITPAAAGCNTADWAGKAKVAASADGFLPANYDHVVYAFPQQASCGGWAGLGEVPGRQSWLNGTISVRVAAHELGHNMGLHHASSLACTSNGVPVAFSSTCTPDEYGDPFDVMGNALRHSNAWHLKQIGFMQPANVQTVSASGTYTITSAIARGTPGQTQLLRIPRPGTTPKKYYDLEVRSSGGVFDNFLSTSPAVQGVTIHVDPEPTVITQSLLIDTTPGTGSGFGDAPLAPGRTFTDGTVTITVSSVSAGTATVDVIVGPGPDTTAPAFPGPVTAVPAEASVTLSWPAATDAVGVAGYRVYRDGTLRGTVSSLGWVDSAVSAGASYSYRVSAFDAAGNTTLSAPVAATVPAPPPPPPPPVPDPATNTVVPPPGDAPPAGDPSGQTTGTPRGDPVVTTDDPPVLPPLDTIRPSVRIVSPGQRARVRRRATLRALAADAVGVVRTEVWVDGRLRKSAAGPTASWKLRRLRRGRHLIVVRAYDAAGNHGRASVRVRIIR